MHANSGEGFEEAYRRVTEGWLPSVSMALCVWPFIHPFNFRFVPIQHRLLVLNICSLGIFSYATFVSEKKTDARMAAALFDAGEGDGNARPFVHGASGGTRGLSASLVEAATSDGDLATCHLDADQVVTKLQQLDGRVESVERTLGCYDNDLAYTNHAYNKPN
eukprot:COSAG05_NODE_88_length_20344_cov_12.094690_12_plen_163_part_00